MSERTFDIKGRLAKHRFFTHAIMICEQLWSALLIPICIIGLYVSVSWFGLFRIIPYWASYLVAALFVLLFIYSLRALFDFRLPSADAVNERLENDNQIDHEGISIQLQSISQDDDGTASALWKEHQARMWAKLNSISIGNFRSDIPNRDPYALRVFILLLLVSGFAYSFSTQSGSLSDAFLARPIPQQTANLTRIDAWVTPPRYTNRAPIFLLRPAKLRQEELVQSSATSIPENSEITIRISGIAIENPDQNFTVSYITTNGTNIPLAHNGDADEVANSTLSYQYTPTEDGTIDIKGHDSWTFSIVPDTAPEIVLTEEPTQARNGALQLTYKAKDDYGIVTARAEIEPVYPSDDHALPLYQNPSFDLQLPRRNSEDGLASTSYDLTDHPLAGEDVFITLIAIDGAGQETRTEPLETILPQKEFISPLAQSIVEQRQVIAFDAYDLPRAIELNDALTILPDVTIPNIRDFLLIKSAREGLALAYSDEDLLRWIDDLWSIALLLEDGDLSLAEQKLRDAQRELSEALENGASDEEIAELMEELRKAMEEFMQALAQNNNANQQAQNQQSDTHVLEQQDLQNMLDQIEQMAKSGNREQAQQMLQDLQDMMNNMQANRQPQQQSGEQNPIEQQLEELGQILRQQQQLMDQTFDMERKGSETAPQKQENGQNGEHQPMTPEELADALEQLRQQQQELQEQLQQLMENMEEEGLEPTEGLGEAGEAMGEAESELGEGNPNEAGSQQGKALQALRKGAQQMLNQLQQQMQAQGQGQGRGQQGQQGQGNQRDPLGRPQGNDREGLYGRSENGNFDDADNVQRAREILKTLRKRLGDNFRQEFEKKYLERLLQPTD